MLAPGLATFAWSAITPEGSPVKGELSLVIPLSHVRICSVVSSPHCSLIRSSSPE